MKTYLLTSLVFATVVLVFTNCNKDDTSIEFLASTKIENKNIVLEVFSGVRCGYCPEGHQKAQSLINTYGHNIVVIDVNAGSYAQPTYGWANFTTEFGEALVSQSDVTGFPAGTVNRVRYGDGQAGGLALNRSSWRAAAKERRFELSPVNIGAEATFYSLTRELTIKVDVYYFFDGNGPNMLNIALLQNGIIAKQFGGDSNYVHNHLLRDFITGQWGDEIPIDKTTEGTKYSKTFTYTVPNDYNGAEIPPGGGEAIVEDMELAIYISENHTNIYTGINVPIDIQ